MTKPEPQPCRRFKHMKITPAFLKHLPRCPACKAVIAHLNRESDILVWMHEDSGEIECFATSGGRTGLPWVSEIPNPERTKRLRSIQRYGAVAFLYDID